MLKNERIDQLGNGAYIWRGEGFMGRDETIGVAIQPSAERARAVFNRGSEALRVWKDMLARGEMPEVVMYNPNTTTPTQAIEAKRVANRRS